MVSKRCKGVQVTLEVKIIYVVKNVSNMRNILDRRNEGYYLLIAKLDVF